MARRENEFILGLRSKLLGANISSGPGEALGLSATAGAIGKAIAPVFKPLDTIKQMGNIPSEWR